MHPSMPNLIVGKIIGMIGENSLEFICLLVQNEFDFLIIIKEALDILMNATDKEAISFYKNNKYDIQNSYNIIISNFIDNELDKKNYLLDCIHFKFTSYYKFAIENSNDKNTKKLMFSDSTKISESIVFNMLDILKTLEIVENRDQFDILSEFITNYPNFTVQGVVMQIATPEIDKLRGEITLLGAVFEKLKEIKTVLNNQDYILAIKAYQERLQIHCIGDLVREDNHFILNNPKNLHNG
jgi:hypothetical protein